MTTVAILGLGASGDAAARLALHNGANVYVSDLNDDATSATRAADLRALGADVELGAHDVARVLAADTVVVSPESRRALRCSESSGRRSEAGSPSLSSPFGSSLVH